MVRRLGITQWTVLLAISLLTPARADDCAAEQVGTRVTLRSPTFAFQLDLADGLRAVAWENRLTTRTLMLGNGPEVEFDIGLPGQPLVNPKLSVVNTRLGEGEAVVELTAKEPAATVSVTYRWNARSPVLRKFVTITNRGNQPWNRLLNVRLGDYRTSGVNLRDRASHRAPDGFQHVLVPRLVAGADSPYVERGFPAWLGEEFFVGLAHPAGVAEAAAQRVLLRQYPGQRLESGAEFPAMEAVYGVAPAGAAQQAFVDHLTSRMRRVVRGHDKPYAIFDNFGSWPYEPVSSPYRQPEPQPFNNSEKHLLYSLGRLAEFQRSTGCRFDLSSIDFWVDVAGDLKQFDRVRFPHGITPIKHELDALGIAPGLWIDSTRCEWSIGDNAEAKKAIMEQDYRTGFTNTTFCRATEPIRRMYTEAFVHHIRANGVRLLKFDNFKSSCPNATHEHLPGDYSVEAIDNSMIAFLETLDRASPDVFLMLYWGFKSPWWLLHGDTLFDGGLEIEAASPSSFPAPYARDSITQKLDQAQVQLQDVPWLGKDSLGVWLSDWPWNSQVGSQRWQEGMVMDLGRGSLLAQPWADRQWLSPDQWPQMADFVAILRARAGCFRHSHLVLGDPRKYGPYGYCGTDGRRAILALDNCTWEDRAIPLKLNSAWGLPDAQRWDLYRWYPKPARLRGADGAVGETVTVAMRPFEVWLVEAVPASETGAIARPIEDQPIVVEFPTASRLLATEVKTLPQPQRRERQLVVDGLVPPSADGGLLVVTLELARNGHPLEVPNVGQHLLAEGLFDAKPATWQPVMGKATYPSCWQAWRLPVPPSRKPIPFQLTILPKVGALEDLRSTAHFLAR